MLETIFSWGTFWWLLMVMYVPACIGLIVIVLLQQGKGTGFMGAMGAGPGGDTIFGAKSGQSVPVKITYVAAVLFMVIAVILSVVSGKVGKGMSPELVQGAEIGQAATGGTSGLRSRGVGTGIIDEERVEEPAAPLVEETTPETEETTDETTEGAADNASNDN